jgi:hypothetical protein
MLTCEWFLSARHLVQKHTGLHVNRPPRISSSGYGVFGDSTTAAGGDSRRDTAGEDTVINTRGMTAQLRSELTESRGELRLPRLTPPRQRRQNKVYS